MDDSLEERRLRRGERSSTFRAVAIDLASQQMVRDNYLTFRFGIFYSKAGALTNLARYDEAKTAITSARSNLTNARDSEALKLDVLEAQISAVDDRMSQTVSLEWLDALYQTCLTKRQWEDAVMVRMNSANIAYQRGRIDLFRQYSQDAITVAEDKKLEYLELVTRIRRYENLLIQDRTGHTLDELQKELGSKEGMLGPELTGTLIEKLERYSSLTGPRRDELRVDLFLLLADCMIKRNSQDSARRLFQRADQLSKPLPGKRCSVHMAWSELCVSLGKLKEATDHAREAVQAAEQMNFTPLKAQAMDKLNNLLARGSNSGPAPAPDGLSATERVMRILGEAHQTLLGKRNLEYSLELTNQALKESVSPALRRAVLRERALVFCELGFPGDAERDLDTCISLLSAELDSDATVAAGQLDNRIFEEEGFHLLKAFLRAKAGKSTEAWTIAERGRSSRLKREIKAVRNFLRAPLEDRL
jgi:tetratricopeptide (TPR) repeat protein